MFESVLASNYSAVALLRYGRLEESMVLLRQASAAIKDASTVESTSPTMIPRDQVARAEVVSVALDDCECTFFPQDDDSNVASFDFFKRGFVFEGQSQSLANTAENACICACVCLYNMALAMHLKGLMTGQSSYLRKASALYQKVFTIVQNYAPEPEDSISSLMLGAVLNIIACENELQGHSATKKWKVLFKDLFYWATQSVHTSALIQQPEEFDFFTVSLLLYSNENIVAASAA